MKILPLQNNRKNKRKREENTERRAGTLPNKIKKNAINVRTQKEEYSRHSVIRLFIK